MQKLITLLVPLFPLLYIDRYTWKKKTANDKATEIIDSIDNFFVLRDSNQHKLHQVYDVLFTQLQEKFGIDLLDVTCYIYIHDSFWITNSSSFKFDRKLTLDLTIYNTLVNQGYYIIRKHKTESKLLFFEEINDNQYLFSVILKNNDGIIQYMDIIYLLPKLLKKIAKQMLQEHRLLDYREKTYAKYRENRDYVNSALNVMHFLRNYLSPVKNVLSMYESNITMTEELCRIRSKELAKAQRSISTIVKEANVLLDKQRNPFADTSLESKPAKILYILLADTCQFMLHAEVIRHFEVEDLESLTVNISSVGVRVLFGDWLGNMNKYSISRQEVHFSIKEKEIIIEFINDVYEDFDSTIIRDINKKDKIAILQRTTHGIFNLISGVEELNATVTADLEQENKSKYLHLIIKFPAYEKDTNS